MPKQLVQTVENSFVNGLVSQGVGLNFPEKGCTDTDNCIFWETGAVTRRLGIDYEDQFQNAVLNNRVDTAFSTFVWRNVADDANTTLLVQQYGHYLFFWDTTSHANISLGVIGDFIDLNDFTPAGGVAPDRYECQFASGHGVLFVTHPFCEPFFIEYDDSTQTFTTTVITVEVRDFEGETADPYPLTERPVSNMAALDNKHHYNLLNQGWTETNLAVWDGVRSDLPSNADVMYLFKNATDIFDPATTVANVMFGNTPAPKGHYILNAFNLDRITASGVTGLETPTTGVNRFSTCAFYAGRVFYSGINVQSYKGNVYFSPVVESFEEFGHCYQSNDPTSEDFFDLLPDDGGIIDIADAGTVFKLFATQTALLVFASNGIWSITGSTGLGFTANDYSVAKIGDVQSISGASFVNVGGFPIWWNYDGIYALTLEGGSFVPKCLTDASIKNYYQTSIPDESKLYARGCYNTLLKTVQWVFNDQVSTNIDENYNFNRMLTLNITTGAFYPWSVPVSDPRINGIFFVESVPESIEVLDVVDGSGNFVVDGSGNQVVVYAKSGIVSPRIVYVTTEPSGGFTNLDFAVQTDIAYEDWASSVAGVANYDSFFTTGYKLHGDGLKKFQPVYVILYAHTEDEDISYTFRSIWDYALNAGTNRWSAVQTLTHTNNNYAYSTKRIKVRGFGRALQFRVDSVSGIGFDLAGWTALEGVNQSP